MLRILLAGIITIIATFITQNTAPLAIGMIVVMLIAAWDVKSERNEPKKVQIAVETRRKSAPDLDKQLDDARSEGYEKALFDFVDAQYQIAKLFREFRQIRVWRDRRELRIGAQESGHVIPMYVADKTDLIPIYREYRDADQFYDEEESRIERLQS